MSLPASFSSNTSPTGVQLDNNFAAVANMAVWNCTASGTNAIALTTTSNQPAVSAYTDRQRFQFVGPNNSNGSVTAAVNGLSALPLYLIGGSQAGSGDVTSNTPYEIIYLAALNSGNGGFQVYSAVPSSAATAQANGMLHGLLMTNNSSVPATRIDITAGYSVLVTSGGTPKFLASVAVTIDLTTTGANGMDVGSRPTSGWVYNYVINNGSVTAGLATATSPTAGLPTLPGGYTTYAYAGAMFCDGSQNLLRAFQNGRDSQCRVDTAITPILSSGSVGTTSTTSPVLSAVTVISPTLGFAPATAGQLRVVGYTAWKSAGPHVIMLAPNTAWGGVGNGPQGTLGMVWPIFNNALGTTNEAIIQPQGGSVGWASSGAGGVLGLLGWTDYWSAG